MHSSDDGFLRLPIDRSFFARLAAQAWRTEDRVEDLVLGPWGARIPVEEDDPA